MAFDKFSQKAFEDFLEVKEDGTPLNKGGFHRMKVPGTVELVYGKRVAPDLTLRIYSTIENGFAREKAKDAIRVTIFWKPSEAEIQLMLKDQVIREDTKWPLKVGGESKVLRVPTWKKNLRERLNHYEEIMPPRCECGCPQVYRNPKKSKGQTWKPFWGCVLGKLCPGKLKEPVKPVAKPINQPIKQATRSVELTYKKWDVLPEWRPIPVEQRRAGSKIPYDQPPY